EERGGVGGVGALRGGGESTLETAGSLAGGSRVWVLARLNRTPMVVAPGDEVVKFLLLSNSHDGSLAVRVGFTPVRVVCNNTLTLAHGSDKSQLLRVKHSSGVVENLDAVRTWLFVNRNADPRNDAAVVSDRLKSLAGGRRIQLSVERL